MIGLVVPFKSLTAEQKSLVEQSTGDNSSRFIEGPPGSGKTCVSLHIVRSLISKEIVQPLVLIYNNSLLGYLRSSFEELDLIDSVTLNTKDKFWWALKNQYNIFVPNNLPFAVKREMILKGLLKLNIDLKYSIVILDEIQDFTELEWKFLKTISDKFIFLGDFEQRVYSSDLKKSTLTSVSKHDVLSRIFRFGKYIASIVQLFSSNKNLENQVDREDNIKPLVSDLNNKTEENETIKDIINARKNDGGRIAVISISKSRLEELHSYLTSQGIEHFHAPNPSDFGGYDFSDNSAILITSASAKGLEFSTVIMVGFDSDSNAVYGFRQGGGLNENIYVGLSRATDHLYVLRNPNTIKELMALETGEEDVENKEDKGNDGWF